ncbi:hypothetical protein TWF281_000171 [Arthrobotrys megalospora]
MTRGIERVLWDTRAGDVGSKFFWPNTDPGPAHHLQIINGFCLRHLHKAISMRPVALTAKRALPSSVTKDAAVPQLSHGQWLFLISRSLFLEVRSQDLGS